ncbi:hypothetical protein LPUS_06982 [Lasallia pustulata]|uniref:Uncharacterized protein n=1 Tax=Lasallia pustulata TaxID=136370 RepID=A0A1W5D2X5_9LECA|nr:hypothetical protein LPUS_06982 [Lasallia pustulata]
MDLFNNPTLTKRQSVTDSSNDQNIGSTRNATSSVSGLVSTLVPCLILALAYVVGFLILRRSQRRQENTTFAQLSLWLDQAIQ